MIGNVVRRVLKLIREAQEEEFKEQSGDGSMSLVKQMDLQQRHWLDSALVTILGRGWDDWGAIFAAKGIEDVAGRGSSFRGEEWCGVVVVAGSEQRSARGDREGLEEGKELEREAVGDRWH